METVYISTAISAGMLYLVACVGQMKGFIERDGCAMDTVINCVLTPFALLLAPLVFGGEYICKCIKASRTDERQNQNTRSGFEGFQERTNNTNEEIHNNETVTS